MSFVQPNALGCSIANHNSAIGSVSVDRKTKLIEDGEMLLSGSPSTTADVSCTVAPNGSSFDFAASESAQGSSLSITVYGLSPTATKDNPSKGTVVYKSKVTQSAFTQEGCNFYFLPVQGVSAGQAWLTFECDKIAQAACKIRPGYAAFEQCLTATK